MSSHHTRAPLPQTHRRLWAQDDEQMPNIQDTTEAMQSQLNALLQEVTGYYDKLGNHPPKNAHAENVRILGLLQDKLHFAEASNNGMQRIIATVVAAVLNPVRLEWDADRYSQKVKGTPKPGHISQNESDLSKYFKPYQLGRFQKVPKTVVDLHGKILLWYLPDIFQPRVEDINTATKEVGSLLRDSIRPGKCEKAKNWRVDPVNFTFPQEAKFESGSVEFSPCWFAARHQRLVDEAKPSITLKHKTANPWLSRINDTEREVDILFSLIAPSLHDSATKAMEMIKNIHKLDNVQKWPTAYSGIAVLANRKTLCHRDPGGCHEWYDLLISAGTHTKAYLKVWDIGAEFEYNPGTAIAICGKVFKHSVEHWEGGERICYAHFMRDDVLERLRIEKSGWVTEDYYMQWMSKGFLKRRQTEG